jgi:xylulokinase
MSAEGLTVGLDAGTGSVKVALLDAERGVLGRGAASYPTQLPYPGWAEQDPQDWWRAAGDAIRQALTAAGRAAGDVTALAISAMGGAVVYLGADGRVLRPSLTNMDRRAVDQQRRLSAGAFGAAVAAASGNDIGAWNLAAKTLWVREHEPDVYAAVRTITSPAGYLLHRCGGVAVVSATDAGILDLFDLRRRAWSAAACAALDVDAELLPIIVPSLQRLGRLRAAAAQDLGLAPQCVLVAGGEDTSCAAFAAGATDVHTGYVSLGTAGVVGVVAGPAARPQPRVLRFPHVLVHQDLLSGSMSAAGAALQWLSGISGIAVGTLAELAATVPPGAGGVTFLPYLAGELHPVNDPRATAVFAGLTIDTTAAHLARAVMEGSANAIAHNLDVIAEVAALPARLRLTGRPARSAVWSQSIADAAGIPVQTVASDGAALADAILAAAGSESAAVDLVARHAIVQRQYEPSESRTADARRRRRLAAALYHTTRRERD